ncbi:hypothetical protein DFJ73DRAFT_870918 [Zopfochytrium polystomum]|nr:hypothetical protein DFJ73DRAFT_870918 [Zopfochytrium polystomum]
MAQPLTTRVAKSFPVLPSHPAVEISKYIDSTTERLAFATLFRLPQVQVWALLEIRNPHTVNSTDLLDFFLRHLPRELLDDDYAMDEARSVEILQWWKDSGLDFAYSNRAIESACSKGRVDLLQWWKDSGLPLKYDARAMELAYNGGRTAVLVSDWTRKSSS